MIDSIPFPIFLIMLAFLLAMAGICVYAGVYARQHAALVQRTKTSSIRVAIPGYVEFEGKAEAVDGQTVTAPLTLSPCCWYRMRIEKLVRNTSDSARSTNWTTVRDETSAAPFLVRDASGVCVVDPAGADVTPTDKSDWYGAVEEPEDRNPPRVRVGESDSGWVHFDTGPNSKYRYREERIYDGDPIFVLGVFSKKLREPEPIEEEEGLEDDVGEFEGASQGGMDEMDAVDIVDETAIEDDLNDRAVRITLNRIVHGSRKEPLILSTTPQEKHIELMAKGGIGAFIIALVPLALGGLLLWAWYG
ncbi:MAG: GIDE domain-containing protein [Candidatus Hydrogenedentes bacterium]|nr:GIDE domain-containing protein [Candidatus Hydrogenedentota bacterium]